MTVREEPQRVQITLDPEIAETIRRIACEQRGLRTEVEGWWTEIGGLRHEIFEMRILVETHEFQLNQVLQRVGDVIEDQRRLRAGFDELRKELRDVASVQGQAITPTKTAIKSEPVSLNISVRWDAPPELFIITVPGTEPLHALEEDERPEIPSGHGPTL